MFIKKNIKINQYMHIIQNVQHEADMYIAGDIADMEWWGDEITPQHILDRLYEIDDSASKLNIFINSYGGSVVAGNFIYDLLKDYSKKKNTQLHVKIANAYSMASGIAMVGDKISMYANGIFMIHKPLSMTSGNADDMRKEADVLDVFETSLIANYMDRFNQGEEVLRDLMRKETWLSAEQALEYGFIDEIIDPLSIENSAKGLTVLNTVFNKKEIVENMLKADAMLKERQKNDKGGNKHEMKFNEILTEKYGISEETFNTFEDVSGLIDLISAINQAELEKAVEDAKEEALKDLPSEEETVNVTELNQTLEVTEDEEQITKDDIVNLVRKARGITPEMEAQYANVAKITTENTKLKTRIVDDAMKSYVRAMGVGSEGFESMKKTLNTLDVSVIDTWKNDWDKKTANEINAGRISEPQKSFTNTNGLHVGNKKINLNF